MEKLEIESKARKERNEKSLSDLKNHYDSLGKCLSEHKEKKDKCEAQLLSNLEKMTIIMKELKNKKTENGLPVSHENQQMLERFLTSSLTAVNNASSKTDYFYDYNSYPDFSDNIVASMVNVKESSKEVREKINSIEGTLKNVEEIVQNDENGNSTDESSVEVL